MKSRFAATGGEEKFLCGTYFYFLEMRARIRASVPSVLTRSLWYASHSAFLTIVTTIPEEVKHVFVGHEGSLSLCSLMGVIGLRPPPSLACIEKLGASASVVFA